MSLGNMFSSPGKQASQAAQASGQMAQQEIDKLLNYTDTHQQQLRDAISAQGPNPYFGAAQQLNTQAYWTNPDQTTSFGNTGPGLTSGNPFTQSVQSGPPPLPGVILAPPGGTAPTPPSGTTPNPNPNPQPNPNPNPIVPGPHGPHGPITNPHGGDPRGGPHVQPLMIPRQ